jgi:predicted NAD-dependent protein-ADP-ribosyltransferase YbiA (DUF1768 family)
MSKDPVLHIVVRPDSKITEYLCNASPHGFFLECKWWATVDHYIHAKKFESTEYEEQMRLASTVFQIKRLLREQGYVVQENGKIIKRPVVSIKRKFIYSIRTDWCSVESKYLEAALREKFKNQHLLKKLLSTRGYIIITPFLQNTGPILQKIRDEKLEELSSTYLPAKVLWKQDWRDIPGETDLTYREKSVVNHLLVTAERIMKMEGCKKMCSEMTEDALYNFVGDREMQTLVLWVDNLCWADAYTKIPKYETMVRDMHETFSSGPIPCAEVRTAALVVAFVRWYRLDATKDQKSKLAKIRIEPHNISLIQTERWYRKMPKVVAPKKELLSYTEDEAERALLYNVLANKLGLTDKENTRIIDYFEKGEAKTPGFSKKTVKKILSLEIDEASKKIDEILS